jgi:hypothetical protein
MTTHVAEVNAAFDVLWKWRHDQVAALPGFVQGMAESYEPSRDQVLQKAKEVVAAIDKVRGINP